MRLRRLCRGQDTAERYCGFGRIPSNRLQSPLAQREVALLLELKLPYAVRVESSRLSFLCELVSPIVDVFCSFGLRWAVLILRERLLQLNREVHKL